jgi:hypothetical protein
MNMEEIREIIIKQDAILDKLTEITHDHEQRLRKVEHLISYGMGILGILSFAASVIWPNIRQ